MNKLKSGLFASMFISALILSGCVNNNAAQSSSTAKETNGNLNTKSEQAISVVNADGSITVNPNLQDKSIQSTGPNGENAVSAKTLKLSAEDIKKIKEGKYTAAIVLHYAGNDWSTAQVKALKDTFEKMGINVVAITDAQFKAEKQASDLETVLAKKPNIIVSVPVDPVSEASAYQKAADAGVKLVFMDNSPKGLKQGKDYVSVVSADNYGNGVEAAHIMAKKLGNKGKIGVIFHDADFFVTKQRTEAFEKTIKEQYPDIKIVARGGITDPNGAEKVASAMLTKHPDLDGIFAVWDTPAEGVLSAARTAGKNNLVITTCDLGTTVALNIAQGGMVKGLGAQLPYDQGVAEAILAGYSLLGKTVPSYVALPALGVNKENLLDSWKTVYHQDAPDVIKKAVGK